MFIIDCPAITVVRVTENSYDDQEDLLYVQFVLWSPALARVTHEMMSAHLSVPLSVCLLTCACILIKFLRKQLIRIFSVSSSNFQN